MTNVISRILETTSRHWDKPMNLPYLTDVEINDICAPLRQAHAQCRYLTGLGMIVRKKPNGRPLVARNEFERALINRPVLVPANDGSGQPDREAYLRLIKKERNGTKTA